MRGADRCSLVLLSDAALLATALYSLRVVPGPFDSIRGIIPTDPTVDVVTVYLSSRSLSGADELRYLIPNSP